MFEDFKFEVDSELSKEDKFEIDSELGKKEKIDEKWSDFAWKLCEIADCLAIVKCNMEAFYLYLLAMVICINNSISKSFFQDICIHSSRDKSFFQNICIKVLQREWKKALYSLVKESEVDTLIRFWERIEKLGLEQEIISEYKIDMEWFFATYQYQNIEFKR